jgi:hypothetical protein
VPSPTPPALDASLRLEEAGVSIEFPSSWQTRQVSQTLTLAPSEEAMDAPSPGNQLVVFLESTPLSVMTERHDKEEVANIEGLFRIISNDRPREAGYTVGVTETLSIGGRPAIAADLEADSAAGRLVVVSTQTHVVWLIGQAVPAAWEEQEPIFDAMVDSLSFSAPETPATPTPATTAAQPVLLTEGPPGFVVRLGGTEGPEDGRFVSVRGLTTAPNGTLYAAESSRGVWVFNNEGIMLNTFGENELLDAYDVALGSEDTVYVADYGQNAIVHFDSTGGVIGRWGETGDQQEQFGLQSPQRIATGPDGNVYALDNRIAGGSGASSVVKFTPEGVFIERINLPQGSAPNDLALDGEGNIYLADPFSNAVLKVDAQAQVLARFGEAYTEEGITPGAVDVGEDGTVYVATWGSGILAFAPDGSLQTEVGAMAAPGAIPQPGELSVPNGIAAAPGSKVWVSDNSGEYSAITALNLNPPPPTAVPPDEAPPEEPGETPTPTPLPEELIVRQWADDAEASSQYNDNYAADGATGEPDVEGCRSSPDAWAPAGPGTRERLEVSFDEPVFATGLNIYQSHQPGAITEVELLDDDGDYTTVYTSTATLRNECPLVLEITFEATTSPIEGARLTIDQREPDSWAEIDAVELVGFE